MSRQGLESPGIYGGWEEWLKSHVVKKIGRENDEGKKFYLIRK
jgi:hypothetical protein